MNLPPGAQYDSRAPWWSDPDEEDEELAERQIDERIEQEISTLSEEFVQYAVDWWMEHPTMPKPNISISDGDCDALAKALLEIPTALVEYRKIRREDLLT